MISKGIAFPKRILLQLNSQGQPLKFPKQIAFFRRLRAIRESYLILRTTKMSPIRKAKLFKTIMNLP